MGEFPNRETQFGGPRGNPRKLRPRAGVLIGKARLKRMREIAAIDEALGRAAPAFDGDALELFRICYKNVELPLEVRLSAARFAAQYERPALSAQHVVTSTAKSLEELLAEKARIAQERGLSLNAKPAIDGEIVGHDVGNIVGTVPE